MTTKQTSKYYLGANGEFVIENYNETKPFASFFPGIAGPHGIPMWVFYVNRGQCLCSIGISDKDHPIMEFLSANRAYQLVGSQGFRTFVKITSGGKTIFYEPFQERLSDEKMNRVQKMIIFPSHLSLQETNKTLGLEFSVDFFNVPEDNYAGLVRNLRIKNTSKKAVKIEVLDGLPLIIPFGVDNYNLNHMRRLVESFVEVINYEKGVPFFKGRVKQEDRPEVILLKEGHFYVGFIPGKNKPTMVKPVVDPQWIFGSLWDYSYPKLFTQNTPFKVMGEQILENRLPCAMGHFTANLGAGQTHTYYSIIGHSASVDELNKLVPRIADVGYVTEKQQQNVELIDALSQKQFVSSSSKKFDLYARQNFLDNVLRGGFPTSFKGSNGRVNTVHLYSRKHGDLERDYNDYRLSPTNYSQGNGNYRDVNQNRRSDLLFNPDVRTDNVEHFYNLIQLDGFNPLGVKITSFSVMDPDALEQILQKAFAAKDVEQVKSFLSRRFTPGEFFSKLSQNKIKVKIDQDALLGEILSISEKHQETDYGHGYWSDHWVYNLDLFENYLSVYPENLRYMLLENRNFTFFDNPHVVLPRSEKYVLWEGKPMQSGAVIVDHEKEKQIRQRQGSHYEVRSSFGKGDVYRTTLLNKIISLIVNKMASLDPEGVGIEMESDKPNWYDALNGLPGLMGSSISETLEVKRSILFLLQTFQELGMKDNEKWVIAVEIRDFVAKLHGLLKNYFVDTRKTRDFQFWDQASTIKESYREQTRMGVSGHEEMLSLSDLKDFFDLALKKLEIGINKAWSKDGKHLHTYFMCKVAEYELITDDSPDGQSQPKKNKQGWPCFRAIRFEHIALPLFLEGPVHFLRIEKDVENARRLAHSIKTSGLYDRKLKMYKVNESLMAQPHEIGRTRTFSRGWLENESIWMHMEYKYLLELLRSGLHKEFFEDIKTAMPPFMDAAVYGRSILENSSFICSSANPDKAIHGNGFVARLSGSTAEFIHILFVLGIGQKPFTVGADGKLVLQLKPVLPGWMFTTAKSTTSLWSSNGDRVTAELPENSFSLMFLSDILVTYINPTRRDTFGAKAVLPRSIKVVDRKGKVTHVEGSSLSGALAKQVRDREIRSLEVVLG